jgi:Na+(H+)/acetate symporter ActP
MNASRIAAVLILVLTAWLAVEAWWLVAPVLEQSWALGIAGRIFLPLIIPMALAIWLWRR